MFSTPKKMINKYRMHPVLGSPLKWLGLYDENPSSNQSTASSPSKSPSPMSSPTRPPQHRPNIFSTAPVPPTRPFFPTDPPLHKPRPSRIPAPYKLGKHRSQLGKQRSIRVRCAPPLKRSSNLFSVEKEAKVLLARSGQDPTNEEAIFLRETSKMARDQQFTECLREARHIANNAINLEEVGAKRRQKLREERARPPKPKTPSGIWLENYRAKTDRTGTHQGPATKFERLVYESELKANASGKTHKRRIYGGKPIRVPVRVRGQFGEAHPQLVSEWEETQRRFEHEKLQKAEKQRGLEAARLQERQRLEAERQRELEAANLRERQRLEAEKQRELEAARLREHQRLEAERQRELEAARLREHQRLEAERIRQAEEAHKRIQALLAERIRQHEQEVAQEYARRMQEEQARLAEEARSRAIWEQEQREAKAREEERARFHQQSRPTDFDNEPQPMDVDEDSAGLSVQARFAENEQKWQDFIADQTSNVRFSDLPWPVLNPGQLTHETLLEFISHPLRPGFQGKALKARVKIDILRWHPDKFTQKYLKKIHIDDQALVLDTVNRVAQFLLNLSSES